MSLTVNDVTLLGNLGQDAVQNFGQNNNAITKFSLATTKSYKDKNDAWQNITQWHSIVYYGQLSDFMMNSLKKGEQVLIKGSVETRKYEQDNQTKYITEIIASRIIPTNSSKAPAAGTAQTDNVPDTMNGIDDDGPF